MKLDPRITIEIISQIADNPDDYEFVHAGFDDGVASKDIPNDRPRPAGGECCALLRFDGTRCGFATFYPYLDKAVWLDILWVHPLQRRRGFGRLLLKAVIAESQRAGCTAVDLGTFWTNVPMKLLAGGSGFGKRSLTYRWQLQSDEAL